MAHRRAVELIPPSRPASEPWSSPRSPRSGCSRACSARPRKAAARRSRSPEPVGPSARGEEGHALCTLGISKAWGDDPEAGVALLREARTIAEELGRLDDIFRATANLTTALDLLGRRREAVDVAMAGIEAARSAGQEAVYGNFLRGNGADSLFWLGRWEESRQLGETALEWSPVGISFVNAVANLAIVEIEAHAGERAGRLLGRLLLELETVPDAQESVPAYRAAASFALWRGDLGDAQRAVDLGWGRVRNTEDWVLVAKMAASVLEIDAWAVADARERRDLPALARARERAAAVVKAAEAAVAKAGVAKTIGSRREADAFIATARAFHARLDGRDESSSWDALAGRWEALAIPYGVARARWRQAEAALAAGDGRPGRASARRPLLEAVRIARELGCPTAPARARGARRSRPDPDPRGRGGRGGRVGVVHRRAVACAVMAGVRSSDGGRSSDGTAEARGLAREFVGPARPKAAVFGLSPREREVLLLLSAGRTNREIGEHLFISQKTVGVHVGNILSKLGVSGRVEAAAVAIRLGLTDRR